MKSKKEENDFLEKSFSSQCTKTASSFHESDECDSDLEVETGFDEFSTRDSNNLRHANKRIMETLVTQKNETGDSTEKCRTHFLIVANKFFKRVFEKEGSSKLTPKKGAKLSKELSKLKNYIPTARAINEYQRKQVLRYERDIAYLIKETEWFSIYFDTTTRSEIEGHVVAFTVEFPNGEKYQSPLPLLLYEDQENLCAMFDNVFRRYALHIGSDPVLVFQKLKYLITDGHSTNTSLVKQLCEYYGVQHDVSHILCCMHSVLLMDECKQKIVKNIEKECKLDKKITQAIPGFASFLRNSPTLTEAVINSLAKVSNSVGASANLCHSFNKEFHFRAKKKKIKN